MLFPTHTSAGYARLVIADARPSIPFHPCFAGGKSTSRMATMAARGIIVTWRTRASRESPHRVRQQAVNIAREGGEGERNLKSKSKKKI